MPSKFRSPEWYIKTINLYIARSLRISHASLTSIKLLMQGLILPYEIRLRECALRQADSNFRQGPAARCRVQNGVFISAFRSRDKQSSPLILINTFFLRRTDDPSDTSEYILTHWTHQIKARRIHQSMPPEESLGRERVDSLTHRFIFVAADYARKVSGPFYGSKVWPDNVADVRAITLSWTEI
ncbi:hypothetical protein EVAR_68446_1 [Eumeta japonica]|uniref:Uncharacterized protein n=1 Tax=Eumeta variegata TaxID=151549 RepID=A0A4C1SQI3_EUMVA|nr:hypothetical protein EVAR_68446_1 [Eumeta japonica]